VLADQNSQRNVKKTLRLQKDAQENTTDVQEDVWEKHVELVQEPLVQQRKLKEQNWKNAEEPTEEAAKDFTAEEKEDNVEEKEDNVEERTEEKEERKEENTEWDSSKKKSMKILWELTAEELQSENVVQEASTNHAEPNWEEKSEKEKSTLEELHWRHVLADQNFQRNVKKNLSLQTNVQENSTDVQEDVWERHAELAQELLVLEKPKRRNAEELTEEVAKDFTAEDTEEQEEFTTEEPTTKRKKRKFTTKEKKRLLCSRKNSLKRNWQHSPKEKQKENALMTKNAELE